MDTKAKESHQFQGEFMRSVPVALQFRTCDDLRRLYTSNLGDFVKDFYELRTIFSSLLIGIKSNPTNQRKC